MATAANLDALANRLGRPGTGRSLAAHGPGVSDGARFGGGTRAGLGSVNGHPRLANDVGDRLKVIGALLFGAWR
jgi:hypothetical protein